MDAAEGVVLLDLTRAGVEPLSSDDRRDMWRRLVAVVERNVGRRVLARLALPRRAPTRASRGRTAGTRSRSTRRRASARRRKADDDDPPRARCARSGCAAETQGRSAYCSERCRAAVKQGAYRARQRAALAATLPEHEELVFAERAAGRLTAEDALLWVVAPDEMRRVEVQIAA